jgi:hypothetical protein
VNENVCDPDDHPPSARSSRYRIYQPFGEFLAQVFIAYFKGTLVEDLYIGYL